VGPYGFNVSAKYVDRWLILKGYIKVIILLWDKAFLHFYVVETPEINMWTRVCRLPWLWKKWMLQVLTYSTVVAGGEK
jgi:hypothetical protein